jgi:Na+-translocating ferredoxin:NAD+ oxidoreductase RnfG subunit
MNPSRWHRWVAPPALILPGALPAYAAEYLSLDQAQRLSFPEADTFVAAHVELTKEQTKAIEAAARVRVRRPTQHVWEARSHGQRMGWVVVDEVYGKHEFITYAVALSPEGSVRRVEILTYRETYGDEIKSEAWRAQFVGKRAGDLLQLDKDVKNISGATLSCLHVTEGIRRILAFFKVALER